MLKLPFHNQTDQNYNEFFLTIYHFMSVDGFMLYLRATTR